MIVTMVDHGRWWWWWLMVVDGDWWWLMVNIRGWQWLMVVVGGWWSLLDPYWSDYWLYLWCRLLALGASVNTTLKKKKALHPCGLSSKNGCRDIWVGNPCFMIGFPFIDVQKKNISGIIDLPMRLTWNVPMSGITFLNVYLGSLITIVCSNWTTIP